jgi:hypothetical protein
MRPGAALTEDELREFANIRGPINRMPNECARSESEILGLIGGEKKYTVEGVIELFSWLSTDSALSALSSLSTAL